MRILVALDQGTTSSRAIVFDEAGHIARLACHRVHSSIYPRPGWVEHDPWTTSSAPQVEALQKAVKMSKVDVRDIAAIGITNQRETTLAGDEGHGSPRTQRHRVAVPPHRALCATKLVRAGHGGTTIRKKTGLARRTPTSARSKSSAWLLDTLNRRTERAERGELCFGTVDSFLAWHLAERRGRT